MKKYLFVMRHFPHQSSHVQEALDQLLTAAAFDQSVSVLFVDNGVFQLKSTQNPQAMGVKNTAAMYSALPLYSVTDLFIEAESLQASGLSVEDLILPVQLLSRSEVNAFLKQHAAIIPD